MGQDAMEAAYLCKVSAQGSIPWWSTMSPLDIYFLIAISFTVGFIVRGIMEGRGG
jgi:hypothetical protein